MKRNTIIALLLMLCLVFCFTLTACGGNSGGSSDVQEEVEEEAEEVVEEEVETLESMVNADSDLYNQVYVDTGTEGLTIDVQGNELIYTYDLRSVAEDLDDETLKSEGMQEALVEALKEGADQFTSLCTQLEDQAGLEGVVMTVVYTVGDEEMVRMSFNKDGIIE